MAEEIKYNIAVTGTGQAVAGINAVTIAQQRLTATSANAGVALQSLNFVIRDSPYFFRDFSLGVLAVGNNINPLIDSMLRLKQEAIGVGQTLGQTLVAALKGPAGIVLAFSVLVTVLQAVTFAMAKNKKETREATEAIKSQRDEIKKLSYEMLEKEHLRAKMEADIFNKTPIVYGPGLSSEERESNKQIEAGRKYWNERLDFIERELILMGNEERIIRRIKETEDKRKQLNEATYLALVPQATSLENARQILSDMIKADKTQLDLWQGKTRELKAQKDYLDMMAEGLKFISDEEEKLFKRRIDLMDKIRERALRGGISPEQAEAFAFEMSLKLQGEAPEMWGGGMKKLPEHPLKKFWKENAFETTKSITLIQALAREAQTMGDVLADAFMRGAKAAEVLNAIAGKILGAFLSFIVGGALGAATGGASGAVPGVVGGAMNKSSYDDGLDINLTGELSAKQDKFIIEFDRAKTKIYKSRRITNIA